jgi:hypothetical protein
MQKYHLIDSGEIAAAGITPLLYGRLTAPVRHDGTVVCDNHLFCIDTDSPPCPGEKLMIWCEHDYFCCKVSDYEHEHTH